MTISQTFEIMVTFLKFFIRLLSQILVFDAPGITEKDENRSKSTKVNSSSLPTYPESPRRQVCSNAPSTFEYNL